MVFYEVDAPSRIDAEFNEMLYERHQLSQSPLINTSVLCIKDFALDYMHLVCLGVVKRLLLYLKEGPRFCRISGKQINEIYI